MKTKLLVPAVLAMALPLAAVSAMAATPVDLLGDPAPPNATADRTITITPDTKYVNVDGGQVVKFDAGGKSFIWNFDGAETVTSFDLNQVAPSGMLDHVVTAYVSPNPLYNGS